MMRFIAQEISDVQGSPAKKEQILEIYNMDMILLAEEAGLGGDVKTLNKHLNMLETIFDEEYVIRSSRDKLIDLVITVSYMHTNYVEAIKSLTTYYENRDEEK
jgi:hypothetical protein